MCRTMLFCFFLLFANLTHAAIYHWYDHEGHPHYGQRPPSDKSIQVQKIHIKSTVRVNDNTTEKTVQDSADELAKSNATRQAELESARQKALEAHRMQERCDISRENLDRLDYGGNRLFRDADGSYSRLNPEEKNERRKQLEAFINENCR